MTVLYLTEQGVRVHKDHERLLLRRGGKVIESVPLRHLEQVVVFGRGVTLTTATMFALARRGVNVVFLTHRGRFVARLTGREHKHVALRVQQFERVQTTRFRLPAARKLLQAKIFNQRRLLQRHVKGAEWAQHALEAMQSLAQRAQGAADEETLRGLEGQSAVLYFGVFRQLLRPPDSGDWGFRQRAYHPPPDPINTLLSFAYTLLLNDVVSACEQIGLDPDVGFFHATDYARPALALDLMEPFRPLIADSVVLQAVNRPFLTPHDFQRVPTGHPHTPRYAVYLGLQARRKIITLYEQRMATQAFCPALRQRTTYRRILRLQAQQFARFLLGKNSAWKPFSPR